MKPSFNKIGILLPSYVIIIYLLKRKRNIFFY